MEDNPNILKDTRCLVIGPMENDRAGGKAVREYVTKELNSINIKVWNHYDNPIMNVETEGDDDLFKKLLEHRNNREYDEIAAHRQIRSNDLALVDKCDIIICIYDKEKFSSGTLEELCWANRCKKPVFVYCAQGKHNMPFWEFWKLPHEYFYNSMDDIIDTLYRINAGKEEINPIRWKLLKPEYR